MKINLLFKFVLFTSIIASVFISNIASAAVSLPWSTTYNCADWTQADLYVSGQPWSPSPLNCDGIINYGNWLTSNGSKEQITSSANYSGGGGGKGQRQWVGDGINNNSGGTVLGFLTPQPELWIRWYMRYEQGFKWNPLIYDKILYIQTPNFGSNGGKAAIVDFYSSDTFGVSAQASPIYSHFGPGGWNTTMVNGASYTMINSQGVPESHKSSDGQWHFYEVHIKMDTNGTDGVFEGWIDGKQILSHTNIDYSTTGSESGWILFLIGSNQRIPDNGRDMYVDFDDIAVNTTGYIGPITTTGTGSDTISPSIPSNLSATSTSSSQINLSWTASTDNIGVIGYKIYRNGTQIATSTTNSYSNTGLTASTLYSYTVSAYDAAGNNSSQSTLTSATTQAASNTTPPANPTGLIVI